MAHLRLFTDKNFGVNKFDNEKNGPVYDKPMNG